VHGTRLHLFSREDIVVHGKLLAEQLIGSQTPGVNKSFLTLEARGDIIIEPSAFGPAVISANANTVGAGDIDLLSQQGAISCTDLTSKITANASAGGSNGGTVKLRAFGDVTYGCTIQATGNAASGKGGATLIQSFRQDVLGNGTVTATGNVNGTNTLTSCTGPTDGGTFNPAKVINPPAPNCVDAPLVGVKFTGVIPPCTPGCACISSFKPETGLANTVVTIKGDGLKTITEVDFSTDCDPLVPPDFLGTNLTLVGGDLQVTVPVGLVAGTSYHLIGVGATGSFCTTDLFTP
jgi:hypothetical protein